jgi:hypothetical protein
MLYVLLIFVRLDEPLHKLLWFTCLFVMNDESMFEQTVGLHNSVICLRRYADVGVFFNWLPETSTCSCCTICCQNTHMLERTL